MKKKQKKKPAPGTALLLIGHGSRVVEANKVLAEVAAALRRQFRGLIVEHAFLEVAQPDVQSGIDQCVATGASRILLVPYFLYLGGHVSRDIPEHIGKGKLRHPGLDIRIAPHLDFDRRIVAVLCERVKTGLRAGRWV